MNKIVCIVCALFIFMSGCALFTKDAVDYGMNVVNLKYESVLIKNQYERIYTLITANESKFTEDEWAQLLDVHFAFTEAASRITEIMDDPKKVVPPAELRQMYELVYIGYTTARVIISGHKEQFTDYQWAQMESFDIKAAQYDKQVRDILDNPDNEDINKTLAVIIALGGAAYKYLLPVVISMI